MVGGAEIAVGAVEIPFDEGSGAGFVERMCRPCSQARVLNQVRDRGCRSDQSASTAMCSIQASPLAGKCDLSTPTGELLIAVRESTRSGFFSAAP